MLSISTLIVSVAWDPDDKGLPVNEEVDNEENEAGIFCFGAAIRGAAGLPVAAISVSTLVFRQKEDPEQAYVAPLLEACRVISERIAQTPSLLAGEIL